MSFLRRACLNKRLSGMSLDNYLIKNERIAVTAFLKGNPMIVEARRGIKTTDTTHPQPIYNEDEKILKKVLEERQQECEDLPIGMANPYEKPQKKCILCEHNITPNFKNIKLLYQFVSPYTGMIYEKHITGLCKAKQEQVEKQVTIANNLGLMSNYLKLVEFLKDPKLCDPERPIKPHKY